MFASAQTKIYRRPKILSVEYAVTVVDPVGLFQKFPVRAEKSCASEGRALISRAKKFGVKAAGSST